MRYSCLGSALIRLALAVVWSASKTIGPIKGAPSLAEQRGSVQTGPDSEAAGLALLGTT